MENFKKALKQIIKHNSEGYTSFYSENEDDFLDLSRSAVGVKSDVFMPNIEDLDKIRFSSVFSDLVNIYPTGLKSTGKLIIKNVQDVTVPSEILDLLIKDGEMPIMQAGYLTRSDAEMKSFIKKIKPLLYKGLVVVHNTRALFGKTNQPTQDGKGKVWQEFLVSPDSEAGNWLVMENSKRNDSFPIDFNPAMYKNEKEIFDVTVPFISNIPIDDLTNIIDDNQDIIASFRKQVNGLVNEAVAGGKNIEEMKQDLVRPQIESIERSFKKIQTQHRYKVAGATLTLASTALVTLSTAGVAVAAATVMGSLGVGGLLASESEFKKGIAELKEQPLYLMWKLKNKI